MEGMYPKWPDRLRGPFSFSKHAPRVWAQLDKLGLASREIALLYYNAAAKKRALDRFLTDDHYFLEWGETVLNPMLNHHLNRDTGKPTFQNMMLFLMKEEVKKYDDLMKRTRPRGYSDHPDYRK